MSVLPVTELSPEDTPSSEAAWQAYRRGRAPRNEQQIDVPDLESRIEALLKLPLRRLELPADIAAFYNARARAGSRKIMAAWCAWVGVLNLPCAGFDIWIVPAGQVPLVLGFRLIITLLFLFSGALLREGKMLGEEHVIIIMPTLLTMAFAGIAGLVCADKTLLIHYLTHGVVIVYTILMLLRLERGHAQFLGVATLALMFACLAASGPHHLAIKLQSATFYTAVMFALLHAKQVQNRYRYRLFLMSTRDELRKAAAIRRNDELSSIAYMDPLTAIPNRRYFEEICASISDTTKALLPLTLVLIDVDYFKNLNDHLGHLQGDRCLRVIATAIRNNLRGNADILARYGGEEFVLLLPGTDSHGAFEVVERIRIAVMSLNHPNPGTPSEIVTVSAGIAVAATRPVSTETLLGSADLALYRAKSTGRNRVCLQTPAS